MTLKEKLDARVLKLQEKQMISNSKIFWNELRELFLDTSTELLAQEDGYTIEVIIEKNGKGDVLYKLPSNKNYYEFKVNEEISEKDLESLEKEIKKLDNEIFIKLLRVSRSIF